jgi:hypothetical protein
MRSKSGRAGGGEIIVARVRVYGHRTLKMKNNSDGWG